MQSTLRDYIPLIAALLAGGLGISLGATFLARSARGQARLLRTGGAVLTLLAVAAVVVGVGAAYWMIRPLLGAADAGPWLESPGRLFVIGLLIGLPFSLPGVVLAWYDARAEEKRRSKRREYVATKDDRRAFANDLLRQMREVSDRPRTLQASVGGDGGRVLTLEGDIEPDEVERLTTALRRDLEELGFKRVEGVNGSKRGWSKV
jgi:hypothetical protein